jgi:hypothetical protein
MVDPRGRSKAAGFRSFFRHSINPKKGCLIESFYPQIEIYRVMRVQDNPL